MRLPVKEFSLADLTPDFEENVGVRNYMDCAPDSDEYFGVEENESHQGKQHCENESSPVGVKSANNKFDLFKLIKVDVRSTKQDLNVLRRRI